MSVYRTSLLAFASLLPIALALPAAAANDAKTGFVILGKDQGTGQLLPAEIAYRDIGGHNVGAQRCHWYNFHQSISLWPVYRECGNKTAKQWRETYHSKNDNGFSENAVALINRQNTQNHSAVYTQPDKHIRLEINKHYDKTPCAWFNYFQSRIRTPVYKDCPGKNHQASYGMYSAPDFLKDFRVAPPTGATEAEIAVLRISAERAWEAKQTGPAPVVVKNDKFYEVVKKQIGGQTFTLNRCEWSNFFQSISFLPHYVACKEVTDGKNKAQLSNYEQNKNLNKITFKFKDESSQGGSEFNKFLTLKVGTKDVTATVCEWYNLVQSEARWPIYRTCPTKTSDNNYKVQTIAGPGADRLVRHKLLYSN